MVFLLVSLQTNLYKGTGTLKLHRTKGPHPSIWGQQPMFKGLLWVSQKSAHAQTRTRRNRLTNAKPRRRRVLAVAGEHGPHSPHNEVVIHHSVSPFAVLGVVDDVATHLTQDSCELGYSSWFPFEATNTSHKHQHRAPRRGTPKKLFWENCWYYPQPTTKARNRNPCFALDPNPKHPKTNT